LESRTGFLKKILRMRLLAHLRANHQTTNTLTNQSSSQRTHNHQSLNHQNTQPIISTTVVQSIFKIFQLIKKAVRLESRAFHNALF
jgi:ribonucleotide monophosphatase NagD (HAD superfamily)